MNLIFSTEMVKAILDGRKTQTRRIIRHPERYDNIRGCDFCCPYGQAGDRLWVKEAWRIVGFMDGEPLYLEYKDGSYMEDRSGEFDPADYEEVYEKLIIQCTEDCEKADLTPNEEGIYRWEKGQAPTRWRSGRFMYRWASRITLEITEVRVERLQEVTRHISLEAEGIDTMQAKPVAAFRTLWDSLNAKRGYGWETNPWVWVISFKLCPLSH